MEPKIMDSRIESLHRELTIEFQKYFRSVSRTNSLKKKCKNTIKSTFILLKIITQATHRESIASKYDNLLKLLNNDRNIDNDNNIESTLYTIIENMVSSIGVILNFQTQTFHEYYQEALIKYSKLTEILSYCIAKIFIENFKSPLNFGPTSEINFGPTWELYWSVWLKNLHLITTDSNKFAKSTLFNILTENTVNNHYYGIIIMSKIHDVSIYIFGKISNLKFFIKACKVYEHCLENIKKQQRSEENKDFYDITIKCSKVPRNLNPSSTLVENSLFTMTCTGLDNGKRIDKFVFFGNHPHCDIILPKDAPGIEEVSFVIFYNTQDFIILDCGEKSYLKKKMADSKVLLLRPGMMIDLAEKALMNVENMSSIDDEDNITGIITYEFLTGELSRTLLDRRKSIFSTPEIGKSEKFLVGRGGAGEEAKILFVYETTIGSKHMYLEYKNQKWYAFDNSSKNGSFLLLKNHFQYINQHYSDFYELMPLLEAHKDEESKVEDAQKTVTITIAGFSFFIAPAVPKDKKSD